METRSRVNRRRLLLGFVLIAAALVLGLLVSGGRPPAMDEAVARDAHEVIGPEVGAALRWTSDGLQAPTHWILTAVCALLALALAGPRGGLVVVLAVLVSVFAARGLKSVYERQRPTADLVGERSLDSRTSYPSGHVVWAASALGSLGYCLARRRSRTAAMLGILFAAFGIAWIGAARIYLGRHYLSDVMGSALLGLGLVIVITALFRRE